MNKIITAVKAMFQPYAKFDGRVSKNDYWFAILGLIIVGIIMNVISYIIAFTGVDVLTTIWSIITGIYGLAILIPEIGYAIRRLHDTGKSGWFVLLELVPCVGWIIVIVMLVGEGQPAANQYGEVPNSVVDSVQ